MHATETAPHNFSHSGASAARSQVGLAVAPRGPATRGIAQFRPQPGNHGTTEASRQRLHPLSCRKGHEKRSISAWSPATPGGSPRPARPARPPSGPWPERHARARAIAGHAVAPTTQASARSPADAAAQSAATSSAAVWSRWLGLDRFAENPMPVASSNSKEIQHPGVYPFRVLVS